MEQQRHHDVESLLNDIYEMPDLKDDVFSYINPYILKASILLARTRRGEKVFDNQDNARKLENILYREFPDLVNAYRTMPIEYRNTHHLKTGKTARQTLINSFHILTQSIRDIEHDGLKDANQLLEVKNQSLREKYQVENFTQTQSEYQDSFSWNSYEKSHVVSAQKLMEQSFYDSDRMGSKNRGDNRKKKFLSVNNQGAINFHLPWQERLKEKSLVIKKNTLKMFKTCGRALKKPFAFVKYIHPFFQTMIGVFSFIGIFTYAMVSLTSSMHHTANDTLELFHLSSEIQAQGSNQQALTNKLIQRFIEEHHRENFAFDAKSGEIIMSEELTSSQCERTIEQLERRFSMLPYSINGINFNAENHQTDDSREVVCENPHNIYSVAFDTIKSN